jgi:serine protease
VAITAALTAALAVAPAAMARGGATAGGGGDADASARGAAARSDAAAGTTGRLLVQLKAPRRGTATAAAVKGVAASAGAETAISVPQLRIAAVKPRARGAQALRALERRLRRDPRVASVRPELRFAPRYVPNDPAFTTPDRGDDGTTVEWWAARENLFTAWDVANGDGARVAIIDTGVDATHPDLQGKIVASADFDDNTDDGPATTDEDGHGTHVASLACGQPDNNAGIAGAGLDCGLLIAKSDLTEGSVIAALTWAADNGAEAINMSFGTDGRFAASPQLVQALQYASGKGAVLVAAAADQPTQ